MSGIWACSPEVAHIVLFSLTENIYYIFEGLSCKTETDAKPFDMESPPGSPLKVLSTFQIVDLQLF